jgi:FkbM family methyltransferase
MAFLLHALRPTDVFVDVGANVGAYTVLASKVVCARSIAFEPVLATVERLREQLRINDIADVVEVRNEGVGDRPGELFFTNNRDATNRVSLLDQGGAVTRVPVTTLDTALPSTGSYVIKIDVEGYEHHVLRGAEALLASHSVVALIIEHNPSSQEFGASVEQVHQKLLDAGFRPIAYEPRARVVTPLDTYDRANPNTVYVKDLEAVRARCETAPPCVVHTAFGVEL